MTTAIIVQARTTSSRLPGKVFADLGGRAAVLRCLDRCARVPDAVVVAAVAGPNGGAGGILASVNNAAEVAKQTSAFGLPHAGDGDQIFRHTGVQTVEIGGITAVGGYVTLVFAITDVADASYPSLLTLDNIRFVEP